MPPPDEPMRLPQATARTMEGVTLPGLASTIPAVMLRYYDSQRWMMELLEGWRREGATWLKRGGASKLAATADSFRDALAKSREAALIVSSISALRLNYDRLEETWTEVEGAAELMEAAARLKK